MPKLILVVAISMIFGLSLVGESESYSGKELLLNCEHSLPVRIGVCMGFIAGAVKSYETFFLTNTNSKLEKFCLPMGSTFGQNEKIAVKYFKEHPEKLHEPADHLVYFAMLEAFPCSKKQEK